MSDEGGIQLDQALLTRSASGDRGAFLEFVDRHQAAVFRFCSTLASNVEDAEDALQETFLTAWRKAGSYQGRGSARSWLFTIARRKFWRASRAPRPIAAGDAEALENLGVAAGWGQTSDASLPLLDRIAVRRAFDSLSPADCMVLVLRDLEGFSNAESAEILGVELAALKSRLHRARLRLMSRLTKGENDAG